MSRLFVFGVIIWLAYFVAKSVWKSLSGPSSPPGQAGGPATDAELIRDPQCGAYFLRTKGVKGVVEGKVIHFCSEKCYDQYLKKVKGEE
ncbi:putative TRASH domain protein [Syntrophobacter sp. SbD1]|nr:putative TRASH domain protein [Syntrophobacter sp. SbD1]